MRIIRYRTRPEAAEENQRLVEKIGLELPVGRLLVVDWSPVRAERPRPMVTFIFDGGTLERPERIRLQQEELDGHAFFEPDGGRRPARAHRLPGSRRAPRPRDESPPLPAPGVIRCGRATTGPAGK
jgi:hypothetical protein